ncbi:MAG: LamG-like jellyroll fold domain-containing protein, partial [Thermoleophilia bacterium]
SSAAVNWSLPSGGAEGYVIEASSAVDFSGMILSSSTFNGNSTSLTVISLQSDTTYYFRAGSLNWAQIPNFTLAGSTTTRTSVDVTSPVPVGNLTVSTDTASSARLTWSAPSDATDNPLNGSYAVQYSTWAGVAWSTSGAQVVFSTSGVTAPAPQARTVDELYPNTTYYFRIWTADIRPNWSGISNGATVATLADQVTGAQAAAVFAGSVTVSWDALPQSPSSSTCEGYRLDASSTNFAGGTVYSSSTLNAQLSALTIPDLAANTTYYFRVGSLNWNGLPNFAVAGSTSTLANAPQPVTPGFLNVYTSSVTANWAALPATPSSSTSEGYVLEASSTNFVSGIVYSSSTLTPLSSTLTVSGLAADTTYYFRAGSLNWNSKANYLTLGSTSTLAEQPQYPDMAGVFLSSSVLVWAAPPGGAQGYALWASSTNFNGTGSVLSSATADGTLFGLAVDALSPNTTWFFKVASLNHNGALNFAAALSTSTLANAPQKLAYDFTGAFVSSVTARWQALPASPPYSTSEGYRLEASSTNFAGGVVYSSSTLTPNPSTLTVSGLAQNTTYFFRVGSLDWNSKANYTVLSATSTLAAEPLSAASTFTMVGVSSMAAQWLANSNPGWTLYRLDLSTAANYTGTLYSSTTLNLSAAVAGLAPNATYYARVWAVNNNSVFSAYTGIGSTITLASQPGAASTIFTPVWVSSLTVNFSSGTPQNPAGTAYQVQLSSFSDFNVYAASTTANLYAAFTGLAVNTTWFAQVRAQNYSGSVTDFTDLSSTATLAVAPGIAVSTYSNLTANGFTLAWSSGSASAGYNPQGTNYAAQISTSANFTGDIIESITDSTSTDIGGLVSGAVYYTRVRALNWQNIASTFTLYGSTTTEASAKPAFLNGTLEVSNSLGQFIDGSLYTDTTTPNIRASVQSAFAPGLAITETPSHLALWHLNDGSGATARDASNHGRNLTLNGSPAWLSGVDSKLGGYALDFNGSSQYGVTPTLFPWRSSAANNQFSVSLWFKTTLGRGFLFQTADSASAGAANYDAEIGWGDTSGKLSFVVYGGAAGARRIISAASAYTDGNWHFVTAVLNPSGMFLYVDGNQAATGALATSANARTYATASYAWVGAASVDGEMNDAADLGGGNYRFFPGNVSATGVIDEVLISTVALTATQVQELYSLNNTRGVQLGAPNVEISTQSGADLSWTRVSTTTISITGAKGTTAAQTFTSSMPASGLALRQTDSPGADTNQVMFIAAALDSNQTTAQYTILVDTTPPAAPSFASLNTPTTYGLTLTGLSGSDPLSGLHAAPFKVQASTDPNFGIINQDSGFIAGPDYVFSGLLPNTTYYARAQARDAAGGSGNFSAFSSNQSLATTAIKPSTTTAAFLGVYVTSSTLGWIAFPASPSSSSARGYELQASTVSDFTGTALSSVTAAVAQSTLTISGLYPNTTYYFRVGSINHAGLRNFINLSSTSTLVNAPQQADPVFLDVYSSSVSAQWQALPASPSSSTCEGYRLEASSTNFAGTGIVYSSSTLAPLSSTLSVIGLDPNTTYFFRVGGLNWNGAANRLVLGSTATLPGAPSGFAFSGVYLSSSALAWTKPAGGAEGYQLQASSTNFNGTGSVLSSATSDGNQVSLVLPELLANTTYFFRAGAVAWSGALNFSGVLSTSTLAEAAGSPAVSAVFLTSAAVTWDIPQQGTEGYELLASSTNFNGAGTVLFSSSTNGGITSLSVYGLLVNTTYSFRIGSLNWNDVLNFTAG